MPALVAQDELHPLAQTGHRDGQGLQLVEHLVLTGQQDHPLEHHVVQPDGGGEAGVVVREAPGRLRQALLEQVDQVGVDAVAQDVHPLRQVLAGDAHHLGRDAVEEAGVARLVAGLRPEARGHRVVHRRGVLERGEVRGHRHLGDAEAGEPPDQLVALRVLELLPRLDVGREVDALLVPLQRVGELDEVSVTSDHE